VRLAGGVNWRLHVDTFWELCMNAKSEELPTSKDLLEMARSLIAKEKPEYQPVSDYRLAKELGFSHQRVYKLMQGLRALDNDGCQAVAEAIGWPLETVLACVYLERAKRQDNDKVTAALERICHRVAITVTPIFIGFLAGIASPF